jgi:acyl carrier protein
MKTEAEIKATLRDWVVQTSGKVRPDPVTDETPLIEQRIISSLQVMDLILFLEQLSGRPIEVEKLKVGVFRSITAIYDNFFRVDHAAH